MKLLKLIVPIYVGVMLVTGWLGWAIQNLDPKVIWTIPLLYGVALPIAIGSVVLGMWWSDNLND